MSLVPGCSRLQLRTEGNWPWSIFNSFSRGTNFTLKSFFKITKDVVWLIQVKSIHIYLPLRMSCWNSNRWLFPLLLMPEQIEFLERCLFSEKISQRHLFLNRESPTRSWVIIHSEAYVIFKRMLDISIHESLLSWWDRSIFGTFVIAKRWGSKLHYFIIDISNIYILLKIKMR